MNSRLQDSRAPRVLVAALGSPLRSDDGFGPRLLARIAGNLPPSCVHVTSARDILTLSRVTSRAQPFTAVNLTEVVQEGLSDLERLLEDTHGHVEVTALPTVEGDRAQLRRVFQNLIANALKFRKHDTPPVIRIAAETRARGFGQLPVCRIRVADNGIGFEERYAERIFGIFERLHGRGEYEGTGVGLAICRKIIERHDGRITAEARPGAGATFTIELPLKQPMGAKG